MNHYQHHIGDYRKDTAHLSLLEHGLYRQALDLYYLEEQPLPLDRTRLMRLLCVRNADEERSLDAVLGDFFVQTEEGYVHTRCERELEAIYAKSDKARESARARWDAKKQPVSGKKKRDDANAMRTQCEGNANGMLPITHNPSTQAPKKSAQPKDVRFDEFWQAYPRKKGDKRKARAAWAKAKCDDIADQIHADLARRIEVEWLDRQFIPYPMTYLNAVTWETDIEDRRPQSKRNAPDEIRIPEGTDVEAWSELGRIAMRAEMPKAETERMRRMPIGDAKDLLRAYLRHPGGDAGSKGFRLIQGGVAA